MNDTILVQIADSREYLDHYFARTRFAITNYKQRYHCKKQQREKVLPSFLYYSVKQITSFQQFHHNVNGLIRSEGVQHPDDVRLQHKILLDQEYKPKIRLHDPVAE